MVADDLSSLQGPLQHGQDGCCVMDVTSKSGITLVRGQRDQNRVRIASVMRRSHLKFLSPTPPDMKGHKRWAAYSPYAVRRNSCLLVNQSVIALALNQQLSGNLRSVMCHAADRQCYPLSGAGLTKGSSPSSPSTRKSHMPCPSQP